MCRNSAAGWLAKAERKGYIVLEEGRLDLPAPRRNPAEFLAVLRLSLKSAYDQEALPPALRDVEPVPWRQKLPPGEVS